MTDTSTRAAAPGGRGPRVVVGVDGAPDSIAALRAGEWAAAARGGTLVAVAAWGSPRAAARAPIVLSDQREAAAMMLREAVVDAFHRRCIVPIEAIVQSGRAATMLYPDAYSDFRIEPEAASRRALDAAIAVLVVPVPGREPVRSTGDLAGAHA